MTSKVPSLPVEPMPFTGDEQIASEGQDHTTLHISDGKPTVQKPSDVQLLEDVPEHRQITIVFSHVSSWVNAFFMPPGLFSKAKTAIKGLGKGASNSIKNHKRKKEGAEGGEPGAGLPPKPPATRQILYDLSGRVLPGEVLALMGPSGSGKTSLLSVVGGRSGMLAKMEGEIQFNGRPLSKRTKRRIGFVLQDDLLFESLTVYETLFFAAMLRLPSSMTRKEKKARVEVVIQALGLDKCRGTIVGGFMQRGISGGERKRLSIGHELLTNPSVLMLDEPTSGLDSTTALRLVSTLRQLASGKRAIITTIHQPSSRMFSMLDKLMLLTEGHAMYYGNAAASVPWFAHLGFNLPYGVNPADYLLDLASADLGEGRALDESDRARWFLVERYESFAAAKVAEAEHLEEEEAEGSSDGKFYKANGDGGGKGGRDRQATPEDLPFPVAPFDGFHMNRSFLGSPQPRFGPQEERTAQELRRNESRRRKDVGARRQAEEEVPNFRLSVPSIDLPLGHWEMAPTPTPATFLSDRVNTHQMIALKASMDSKISPLPETSSAEMSREPSRNLAHHGNGQAGARHRLNGGAGVEAVVIESEASLHGAAGAEPPSGAGAEEGSLAAANGAAGKPGHSVAAETGRDKENPAPADERWGSSFWVQIEILMIRSFKTRRFEALGTQRFFQVVAVAIITGLFWLQKGGHANTQEIRDTQGLLFFELLFGAFSAMFSALFTFPSEYRMLLKERASGMYRLSAFYIARTVSDLPLNLTYPSLFVIIVYWVGGLKASAAAFFFNWFVVMLMVLTAESWGLLIGATVMNLKTAQTIATILTLAFMLVGGFYTSSVPSWLKWVKWLSFVWYGFAALTKTEFRGSDTEQYTFLVNVNEWRYEALVLVGWIVALRIAIYVVLRHKTSKV